MGRWRAKVTITSDCFRWVKELISCGIIEFKFKELSAKLKNKSMLHRAVASDLLIEINIDNKGTKTWELNVREIMRIYEDA
jgi:hypothetical protein